jgi:hypothetical protein
MDPVVATLDKTRLRDVHAHRVLAAARPAIAEAAVLALMFMQMRKSGSLSVK